MRIALLRIGRVGAHTSGYSVNDEVSDFGRALAAKGHEVHLFEALPARGSRYQRTDGVHYHTVSIRGRNGAAQDMLEHGLLYYLRCTQNVAGLFDVLHCFDSSLLPVAGQMLSSGSARSFLSISSDRGASPATFLMARRRGWHLEEVVDAIIVSSRPLKNRLLSRLGLREGKLVVLGHGVDMSKYGRWVNQGQVKMRHHMGPLDPVALFVGEICSGSGADVLIETTFALVRQFNTFKVVFAGDGPMQPYLRERARVLGVEGSVRFFSFLPEDQLIDLYNACDLVFVPEGDKYASKTILEAWSAGKPTIIPRKGQPDFVEAGIDALVTKVDPRSLTEAIGSILADPVRARTMGDLAWRKVKAEFSWSAIADKTIDVYSNTQSRRTLS